MKWIVPAVIIGLVGGILDDRTDINKFWCFLIGVAAYLIFLLIKSLFITVKIMRSSKGKKKVWLDHNNNIVKSE